MRKYATALFVAASLALTACSGEGEPKASDSPPPTKEEIVYYDCLKANGVKIRHTDYGAPRVNKDDPPSLEKLPAAQAACEDKAPPPPSPVPADPKILAASRAEARCLRANGVSWYPDPDPTTGNTAVGAVTSEQAAELRTKHMDAMTKCRAERDAGAADNVGLGR
ncbi:hypothetical protein ACFV9E_15860 [Streptomyces sp. NPDC059835]|uniref:hypothetical protein n=1 Tax=Streptomyces sp. NPDC059835 TaxID=3346967 RepID=UPI00364B604B